MDSNFKPRRTGLITVLEKYPCGSHSKGRCSVYYLCKYDCGKEFIVSGDELSKHPYSCGCTPKPIKTEWRTNDWALGYDRKHHTMTCMLKATRHVYISNTFSVSGVTFNKKRKKWEAQITNHQHTHFLGYYLTKEEAIKARIEAERKYWEPILNKKTDWMSYRR